MKTYPVFDDKGRRSPIFQIENIYIGPTQVAQLLAEVPGVADIRPRKMFARSSDTHVQFNYRGCPYIVWEPYGDNSRYWIGPADMVDGASNVAQPDNPNDIAGLEDVFKRYSPTLHRALLGNIISFRFITRFLKHDD